MKTITLRIACRTSLVFAVFYFAVCWTELPMVDGDEIVSSPSDEHQTATAAYVKELERDWNGVQTSVAVDPSSPKDEGNIELDELVSFLDTRLRSKQMRLDCVRVIAAENRDAFSGLGVNAFVLLLTKYVERETLVSLLAQVCPRRVYTHAAIEFWLVYQSRKTLSDGLLVLCDAYDASCRADTRREIVTAIRQGMRALGVISKDDAGLVRACRKWYAQNKSIYVPNREYGENVILPVARYATVGLFVRRECVDEAR
jgi:hypothetical protein